MTAHEIGAWCREKLLEVFCCGYNEAASGTPKEAVLIQFDIYAAEINADPKQLEVARYMINWAYQMYRDRPNWTPSEAEQVMADILVYMEEQQNVSQNLLRNFEANNEQRPNNKYAPRNSGRVS
jgi:hypothetical protein